MSKELTPEDIVKKLADWSIKYPRDRIYGFSKMTMDDELVEIEELAKQFTYNSLTSNSNSNG